MDFSPKRIDLTFPKSWNECTTKELLLIARIMQDFAMRATRLKPFDMFEVKVAVFFALSKIEILAPVNPAVKVEDQYYLCKLPDTDPFNLYLWQIQSWLSPLMDENGKQTEKGILSFLDSDEHAGPTLFPIPEIKRRKHWWSLPVKFKGAEALMQDFSWQRYRFVQDYMAFYYQQQNILVQMSKHPGRFKPEEISKQAKTTDLAKAMTLATLYCRKIGVVDAQTKKIRYDYAYQSNQHSDNAEYFRNFPEDQWQVILFWWAEMMKYLQQNYPRCFKKTKVEKNEKTANPLELYTRTTATMEKYLGLDEEKVNRETFHIVLQHMENMAKESEELEKVRKKK